MTVKELLNSHYEINLAIDVKLEQLEELKSLATKVTVTYSESHSTGTHADKVGRFSAKMVDLENEINEEIDKLVEVKLKIKGILAAVKDPKHKAILERRYILNESFEKMAEKINYSSRHIQRMHNAAIEQLEKIYADGISLQ